MEDALLMISGILHPSRFPNLSELVLRCHLPSDGTNALPARQLRRVLLATRNLDKLRVLRVEWDAVGPLPASFLLRDTIRDEEFPPSLEYLVWHALEPHNKTQYLRVHKRGLSTGWMVRELGYLPLASALRVDADGVWNQTADLQASWCLLDHSVFPPRLLGRNE